MTGSYVPGPLGKDRRHPLTDAGTLVRVHSDAPDDCLQVETNIAKIQRGTPSNTSRSPRTGQRTLISDGIFISVSFIVFQPVTVDYEAQLATANSIFLNATGISFHCVDSLIIPEQMSRRRIANLTLDWGGTNSEAPMNAIAYSPEIRNLTGRIKIFVVRSTGWHAAFAVPRALDRSGLGERVYLSDNARADTLAHEFGHILLNHAGIDIHESETNNLMNDGNHRTGINLSRGQINTMRENARRTVGTNHGW